MYIVDHGSYNWTFEIQDLIFPNLVKKRVTPIPFSLLVKLINKQLNFNYMQSLRQISK